MEAAWDRLINRLRIANGIDQRRLSIAATQAESALMFAIRAVTGHPAPMVDRDTATSAGVTLERL